jgi:tetratricopeptide (TPR) repeat protein
MDAAASEFRESARLEPLKEGDQFTLAMAYVALGDRAQARANLSELLQAYPQRAIYLYWLGRLDYDQGWYADAVEKLTRTTELDPKSCRVWDSLGLAFDMQGRIEQALPAFQKAVSLNREQASPSAWPPHDLGYLLLRTDRLAEADASLRESLQYDSGLAQTHLYLGRVLEKEGLSDEAIREYASAVSLDRASADACYSLAMLYRKSHRDSDAELMFSEYRKRRQAFQTVATSPNDKTSR